MRRYRFLSYIEDYKLRVVIFGGSGLLAVNWAIYCRESHDIHLVLHNRIVHFEGVSFHTVNNFDEPAIESVLKAIKPDLVVNTVALTNVDYCEQHQEVAFATNSTLASLIAGVCVDLGIKLLHISTDQLFDGKKNQYREDDVCSPINVYGRSKLAAENNILNVFSEALIVRTNFFGWGTSYRQSYNEFIERTIQRKSPVYLSPSIFFTPVYLRQLVEYCMQLAIMDAYGIFHVSSDERVSKSAFGQMLCVSQKLDPSFISDVELETGLTRVIGQRPRNMALKNQKLKDALGIETIRISDMLHSLALDQKHKTSVGLI